MVGLLAAALLVGCGPDKPPASWSAALESPGAHPAPASHGAAPTALRIPSINLDSAKVSGKSWLPLGLESDGTMKVPDVHDPTRFGWYCPKGRPSCGAPFPGDVGGSVIVSHVNGGGHKGGFYDLRKVKIGDTIEVDTADGHTQVFRTSQALVVRKQSFPIATVWGESDHSRLSLITCGGELDAVHHNYLDQVIVVSEYVTTR